jgi:hypothetical protein
MSEEEVIDRAFETSLAQLFSTLFTNAASAVDAPVGVADRFRKGVRILREVREQALVIVREQTK